MCLRLNKIRTSWCGNKNIEIIAFRECTRGKKIWFVMLASLFDILLIELNLHLIWVVAVESFLLYSLLIQPHALLLTIWCRSQSNFQLVFVLFPPPANANNERVYVICDLFLFITRKNCLTSSSSSSFFAYYWRKN